MTTTKPAPQALTHYAEVAVDGKRTVLPAHGQPHLGLPTPIAWGYYPSQDRAATAPMVGVHPAWRERVVLSAARRGLDGKRTAALLAAIQAQIVPDAHVVFPADANTFMTKPRN